MSARMTAASAGLDGEFFSDWLDREGIAPCTSVCSTALSLAVQGVRVFPLIGKQPDSKLTPNGVKNATDQIRRVVRWFLHHPERNVGIAIGVGALANVRVLDTDPRHGGDRNLEKLIAEHGPLPETLTVETGRRDGGTHRYYVVPPGEYREKLCGRDGGIEFLGRGKYVVAATSVHPGTGLTYRVISPAAVGIRLAPAWLVRLARVQRPEPAAARPIAVATPIVERARRYLEKCDPAISGSHGHDQTFIVALKMTRGFGLDVETAFSLMASDYNPRCKPPWSVRDLRRKVEQAAERGRMTFGALASAPRRSA